MIRVRSKLDSKKIGELVCDGALKYVQNFAVEINGERIAEYKSLDKVASEWEDYVPQEPRIEDERIRKAVRAWFNLLPRLEDRQILYKLGILWVGKYSFDCGQYDVLDIWLEEGERYNIDELCGEEE